MKADFSEEGRVFIDRCLGQSKAQFPTGQCIEYTKGMIMEPITKAWAQQFMEQRVYDGASIYMDAVQYLKEKHRYIYTAMQKKAPINLGYEENNALEEAFTLPGLGNKDDDKNDCDFGALIPVAKTTDHRGIKGAFNVEADQVFRHGYVYQMSTGVIFGRFKTVGGS